MATSLSRSVPTQPLPQKLASDHADRTVWDVAADSFAVGDDIFFPGNLIEDMGENGMTYITQTVSARTGRFCLAEYLVDNDLWRIYAADAGVAAPLVQIPRVKGNLPTNSKKPPRPRNCFILYRDSESKRIKAQCPEMSVQEISKIVGQQWRSGGPELQAYWKLLARKEKEEHARRYPDYKYSPRKPGQKKKRRSRKTAALPSPIVSESSTNKMTVTHAVNAVQPSEVLRFNHVKVIDAPANSIPCVDLGRLECARNAELTEFGFNDLVDWSGAQG